LRLAEQNRLAQAAARALNIDSKRLYQWQKAAQTLVAAALGASLDLGTATELRQLRATEQRAVGSPKTPTWETALVKVFGHHKRRYGTRRLQVALRRKGYQRLRTAMRRQGLRALQPEAYTPRTTNSTYGLRCAPNRLHSSIGYQTPYSTYRQLPQTTALNCPAKSDHLDM